MVDRVCTIFVEDTDDSDSINTNTTNEDYDSDQEFDVETILSEVKEDGVVFYLTKWAGYPLCKSSWLSADFFATDEPVKEWELHKEQARLGRAELFDVNKYIDAVQEENRIKEEKKARRKAKRHRRREAAARAAATEIASRQSGRVKNKQVASSSIQRKGVARKSTSETASTSTFIIESDDENEDVQGNSALSPLLVEDDEDQPAPMLASHAVQHSGNASRDPKKSADPPSLTVRSGKKRRASMQSIEGSQGSRRKAVSFRGKSTIEADIDVSTQLHTDFQGDRRGSYPASVATVTTPVNAKVAASVGSSTTSSLPDVVPKKFADGTTGKDPSRVSGSNNMFVSTVATGPRNTTPPSSFARVISSTSKTAGDNAVSKDPRRRKSSGDTSNPTTANQAKTASPHFSRITGLTQGKAEDSSPCKGLITQEDHGPARSAGVDASFGLREAIVSNSIETSDATTEAPRRQSTGSSARDHSTVMGTRDMFPLTEAGATPSVSIAPITSLIQLKRARSSSPTATHAAATSAKAIIAPGSVNVLYATTTSKTRDSAVHRDKPTGNEAVDPRIVKKAAASAAAPRSVVTATPPNVADSAADESAPNPLTTGSSPPNKEPSRSRIFQDDWAAPKTGRQRQRVSGETPKDSTDGKFTCLSIQNKFQKYSRNEPIPNPEMLVMMDPSTGKKLENSTNTTIQQANGRRSPPKDSTQVAIDVNKIEAPSKIADHGAREPLPAASNPKPLRKLCQDWQAGYCRYDNECRWAHSVADSTKSKTCHFWARGRCSKRESECHFAHEHTGIIARPPEKDKKSNREDDERAQAQTDGRISARRPKKEATCRFWAGHGCYKSAEACEYAHYHVGIATDKSHELSDKVSEAVNVSTRRNGSASPTDRSAVSVVEHNDAQTIKKHAVPGSPPTASWSRVEDSEPTVLDPLSYETGDMMAVDPRKQRKVDSPVETGNNQSKSNDTLKLQPRAEEISRKPKADEITARPQHQWDHRDQLTWTESDSLRHLRSFKHPYSSRTDVTQRLLLHDRNEPVKYVMIYFPPHRKPEQIALQEWFKTLNCRVYSSREPHHWGLFQSPVIAKSSLLILHPEEKFLNTIPGLSNYFHNGGYGAQVYSLGVSCAEDLAAKREGRNPVYREKRLFVRGRMTFISDDVFYYYPEKATAIIKLFLKGAREKKPGREISKIAARPGILDWLQRVVDEKFAEQRRLGQPEAAYDWRWREAYDSVLELCSPDRKDDEYVPRLEVLPKTSYLRSGPISQYPNFEGLWERNQEASTVALLDIFNEYVCSDDFIYRWNMFIYARPDSTATRPRDGPSSERQLKPDKWTEKFSHIFVTSPEKMVRK